MRFIPSRCAVAPYGRKTLDVEPADIELEMLSPVVPPRIEQTR
jgi:hypothetical protein